MSTSDKLDDLMLEWEAARQQGRSLSAEELCADFPSSLDELRRRMQAILEMEVALGLERTPARRGAQTPEPLPAIPGFDVLRVLDEGGMGIVYEARQRGLGRRVALKMMAGPRLAPKAVARFKAEAEAAARLHHPNFVQVFEVGHLHERPFFAMEYVEGGSLAALLDGKPLPARRAAELAETLARAVHAAHEAGIVHRDLKPANVLLAADGAPKIGDFGLAKRLDAETDHTHTGEILGTPSYMAPEQAEGHKHLIGPATDVYALGAVLYEMLTGRPPFKGASALESMRLLTRSDPTPPSRLAPATPRDLEAICLKCLEKAPARRYLSALALADDLRCFLDGKPVTARRAGPLRRSWKWARRHPRLLAALALLFVAAFFPVWALVQKAQAERELRLKAERQAPFAREILRRNCFACHGADPKNTQRQLNVLDHGLLLDSKRRIVVPGAPDNSRLIKRITDGSMPPEEEEERLPRLTHGELTILRDWVEGGAPPFPPEDPKRPVAPVVPYSKLAAEVKKIFHDNCYECHKYDVAKNGIKILHHRLLLDREVIIPGQPADSELFQLITSADDKKRMPPPPMFPLSDAEIDTVRRWILEGAAPFPRTP